MANYECFRTPSPGCAGYSPDSPPHEAGFAGTPVAGESLCFSLHTRWA